MVDMYVCVYKTKHKPSSSKQFLKQYQHKVQFRDIGWDYVFR